MNFRLKHTILLLILAFNFVPDSFAQTALNRNWDAEKIKGIRYVNYPNYNGFPFLNKAWDPGKINLKSGEIIDSLHLKYSSYKDELLYYNKENSSQIVIDKEILSGFSFTDVFGKTRIFTKLPYDDYLKGDHFFEVLTDGKTKLLVFRKVEQTSTTPYKDEQNILKNMEYSKVYEYLFYSPEKGYANVKCNAKSFLGKFDKVELNSIKKLLRKNRIRIKDEESLIEACIATENEGFQVQF